MAGFHYRVLITPKLDGLEMRFTVHNQSNQVFHNLLMVDKAIWPRDDESQPQMWGDAIVHTIVNGVKILGLDKA